MKQLSPRSPGVSCNNQVKRWEAGEGRKLGKGVGWALNEGEFLSDFTERLFEQGARFYEAETD